MSMNRNRHAIAAILVIALVFAGCSAGAGASASPSPSPSFSLVPVSPSPGASSSSPVIPATGPVSTPDEAAARVIAENPRFEGIGARDPDLIGGCCWYEATAVPGGFQVVVTIGWGDCPSGCINEHVWTFAVTPAGEVGLIGEKGEELPPGDLPA
jgi:hypothetical protein